MPTRPSLIKVMLITVMLIAQMLILAACSETETNTAQPIPAERFNTEHEVLFQEEAALRHTLEELQTQEKEEEAFQAVPAVE